MLEHIYAKTYIFAMVNNPDTFYKMLADNTRLRCLLLMQAEGELCVCELTHAMRLSQPKISRHLAHLRDAGLLIARREGTWMHYRINPGIPAWAMAVLRQTLRGVQDQKPFINDRNKLACMPDRPSSACCNA